VVEELIDNTNGFLIEPKSVDAISKSIQAALELGQDEVLQLSTQSIHKIKSKFTWSLITAETIDIFQRVLEKS
jgi:glycosyltransferase involved in cell wall biosynthesis